MLLKIHFLAYNIFVSTKAQTYLFGIKDFPLQILLDIQITFFFINENFKQGRFRFILIIDKRNHLILISFENYIL